MHAKGGRTIWIRLMLRLYPTRFRDQFGAELIATYRAQHAALRSSGSRIGQLALAARTMLGLLTGAMAEWIDETAWMRELGDEVQQAARSVTRAPGLPLLAAGILGSGLALVVSVYAFLHAALLRPLPYPEVERLVAVGAGTQSAPRVSVQMLERIREVRAFDRVVAWQDVRATIGAPSGPTMYEAAKVESGFFDLLGATPGLGRIFSIREAAVGASLIVIGHDLWMSQFGGATDALGRTVLVDDRPHTIIGVTAEGFSFGHRQQLWLPLHPKGAEERGTVRVLARLQEDVSAQQGLNALREALSLGEGDGLQSTESLVVTPDFLSRSSGLGPLPWIFLGMAALVLLVVCSNVGGLLLARAMKGRRDVAIKAALGASRGCILRQGLFEGACIAGAAGLLATLITRALIPLIPATLGGNLPFWLEPRLDGSVAAFTGVMALATIVFFALLPAFEGSRRDLRFQLTGGDAASTPTLKHRRLRRVSVGAQVGMAFILALAFSLSFESARRISAIDWEVDVDRILQAQVRLSEERYGDEERARAYWTIARERLATIPDVQRVTIYGSPVALRSARASDAALFGPPVVEGEELSLPGGVTRLVVDPSYFEVLGLPPIEGRLHEVAAPEVLELVVSRRFASLAWPGQSAVGKTVRMGRDGPRAIVVGVAEDQLMIRSNVQSMRLARAAHLYLSEQQVTTRNETLLIRTRDLAEGARELVAEELQAIDPRQPTLRIETLRAVREEALIVQRILMRVFGPFAACALFVALIGLYALVLYDVEHNRREMSIRTALGASGWKLMRGVLRQSMVLCALSVTVSALVSVAILKLVGALLLFESPGVSAGAHAGASALVLAATLLASAFPAWKTTRVDPTEALKAG